MRRPPFRELGTYRGDNRLVYFDINDFDEAVLAACTFEMSPAKSIGSLLAGLQLSVTQPIRIAEQVIVEGEFGTTATYPSPGLECEARLL